MTDQNKKSKLDKNFTQYGKVTLILGIVFVAIALAIIRYLPIGTIILLICGGADLAMAWNDHRQLKENKAELSKKEKQRDALSAASAAALKFKKEDREDRETKA